MKQYFKNVIKKCSGWLDHENAQHGSRNSKDYAPHHVPLKVAGYIEDIIDRLRHAGFETYIVGGAIRDLLQDREPKDYDIATAATPEEVRNVFGRRSARIIGKRFKLVHLYADGEIVEISTFRRMPNAPGAKPAPLRHRKAVPEKLIFEDNEFGTAVEDAWRRDFTVNALFYNPLNEELFDFTGMGMEDIRSGTVRVLGEPRVRFEEDPVRLLRALKLVGQYDFKMEPVTEKALLEMVQLLCHASPSRLTLELEKILKSVWADKILQAMQRYGLLYYFLHFLAEHWDTPQCEYAMRLLAVRNERVRKGYYRASISIAMAALTLPFVEEWCKSEPGSLWQHADLNEDTLEKQLRSVLTPHCMIKRLSASAEKILSLQPRLKNGRRRDMQNGVGLGHALEFLKIQNEALWHSDELIERWKNPTGERISDDSESAAQPKRRRRRLSRKPGGKGTPDAVADAESLGIPHAPVEL